MSRPAGTSGSSADRFPEVGDLVSASSLVWTEPPTVPVDLGTPRQGVLLSARDAMLWLGPVPHPVAMSPSKWALLHPDGRVLFTEKILGWRIHSGEKDARG